MRPKCPHLQISLSLSLSLSLSRCLKNEHFDRAGLTIRRTNTNFFCWFYNINFVFIDFEFLLWFCCRFWCELWVCWILMGFESWIGGFGFVKSEKMNSSRSLDFYAYSRLNCSISRLIYEYSGLIMLIRDLM